MGATRRRSPAQQLMLYEQETAWLPWLYSKMLGVWEQGLASLWEEEAPEGLTDAQRGPPPARSSCGEVMITGNVCVSPRPHHSLSSSQSTAAASVPADK